MSLQKYMELILLYSVLLTEDVGAVISAAISLASPGAKPGAL
jgi:hypothetical protein